MLGDDEMRRSMVLRGRELYRNKYRAVFTRGAKAELMARVSNLMIWSDNDVANDFTTMRVNGVGLLLCCFRSGECCC